MRHEVAISGATGFLGQAVTPVLVERGHTVTALVRRGSEARVAAGARAVAVDPFDPASLAGHLTPGCTLIHLVGAKHPAPWKHRQFRAVDLRSVLASVQAAATAGAGHFVYLSVAQPAPIMKAYIQVRQEGEAAVRALGIPATILRPWYVMGPGRRWPVVLLPFYRLCESIPATRDGALRLGLVTIEQMATAMVHAVEHPPDGVQVLDPEAIRRQRL